MFEPVRPIRMVENIVLQIVRSISNGQIKVGEKLPGERILSEKFSVGRNCVREALRKLETMGLIEVRQGLGTVVVNVNPGIENPEALIPWLSQHRHEVIALLEVREALESKAAFLAASRITADELSQIEEIVQEMKMLSNGSEALKVKLLEQLDIEFHTAIAEASGNSFLSRLTRSITHALESDRRAILSIPGRRAVSIGEHERVLNALKACDPERAMLAMAQHVRSAKDTISKNT